VYFNKNNNQKYVKKQKKSEKIGKNEDSLLTKPQKLG